MRLVGGIDWLPACACACHGVCAHTAAAAVPARHGMAWLAEEDGGGVASIGRSKPLSRSAWALLLCVCGLALPCLIRHARGLILPCLAPACLAAGTTNGSTWERILRFKAPVVEPKDSASFQARTCGGIHACTCVHVCVCVCLCAGGGACGGAACCKACGVASQQGPRRSIFQHISTVQSNCAALCCAQNARWLLLVLECGFHWAQ